MLSRSTKPLVTRLVYDPLKIRVIAPAAMPELKQVKETWLELHKDSCLREALGARLHGLMAYSNPFADVGIEIVEKAEAGIRFLHVRSLASDFESTFSVVNSNKALANGGQALVSSLETIRMLCDCVSQAISPSETKSTPVTRKTCACCY
jgi:hypothetical protein